jgi:uncharacterized protein YggE
VKKLLMIGVLALLPLATMAAVCGDSTTQIENSGDGQPTGISVTGEGTVTAAPDMAIIQLGVNTLRPTVAEAREAAAAALQGMIDAMKAQGVADEDLQTSNLSIYPEYDYNNDQQVLRGFRVSNSLVAKVRKIDSTSDLVDAAVVAGGDETTINGISFTIDDPETLRAEARQQAVEDARARAETLASASGVSIGDPISINETSYSSAPIPYAEAGAALDRASQADFDTPIQTGELDVVVSVTVTWAIE